MLNQIKSFLKSDFFQDDFENAAPLNEEKLRLACAALLIEVAIVDNEFDAKEFEQLQNVLQNDYALPKEQCETLAALAQQECEQATSTYQFTQLVNKHCSPEDKYKLIKGMWSIAYADGNVDKYEEYVIRKVSDLIYVSHGEFIKAKIEARPS